MTPPALSARRKPGKAAQEEIDEGLPQASGGRKEYKDDEGKVTKVVEWFGFKLHLLVDVKHEVVLAYEITDTKAGDGETLPVILEQAEANLPADRIETLAYDKAADSDDVHRAALRQRDHAADPDAGRCGRPSRSGCCRATTAPRTWCTTKTGRSIVMIR